MKKRNLNKGFTLLEMVIVIMIISFLFLLTVPNIQKVLGIVDEKGCEAQLKVIDAAILQYELKNDSTPSSTSDLISEGLITDKQTKCRTQTIGIQDGQAFIN